MIESHGYPLETHQVQTKDGYILSLTRIPYGKSNPGEVTEKGQGVMPPARPEPRRPAVLLVHGVIASSELWFINSPEKCLPYRLVDEGFDCWVGNLRGTPSSKGHVCLSTDSRKYWDFSINDIGLFDVPAMIKYILERTGNEDLFFVGHSMGAAVLFIALALKPAYLPKIKLMVALAPAVYVSNLRNRLIRMALPLSWVLGSSRRLYRKEAFKNSIMQTASNICPPFRSQEDVASWIINSVGPRIGGFSKGQIEKSKLAAVAAIYPMPTSLKVISHGTQCFYSGKFRQYDYGRSGNMKLYGQRTPPIYDLSKINIPVVTFCSESDQLCTPKDVKRLVQELPKVVGHFEIRFPRLGHADFLVGKDASETIYDKVIDFFRSSLDEK